MLIFHNPDHAAHAGRHEMHRGRLVDCHETPARLDFVLAELARRPIGELRALRQASASDAAVLGRIHDAGYLAFLESAWRDWIALDPANAELDVLPSVWPARGMRFDRVPLNFSARVGRYGFDAGTPITAGTWAAARAGAACAVEAARSVGSTGGSRSAFALTRPPGHHAGADFFGGYCFLNNAALAAEALREAGAARVAVLDVDYHHGNGTQAIFYERADVLTVSLHGDPLTEYPYYLGHADEAGAGAGLGFNLNLPLAAGTEVAPWMAALRHGLARVTRFGAEALVVPLGVDTFEGDPISRFALRSRDYLRLGTTLASAGLPTVFVLEGGYAVEAVGINVVNVLEGFGD